MDYTEDLRKRWRELPGEKLAECKQLLFPGEIIVQPDGNVYIPFLSYIYSLGNKNDDPKVVENGNMVEHLEKSSPLIIEEVRRWRDLLWDDYLDYKYQQKRQSEVHYPLQHTPPTT